MFYNEKHLSVFVSMFINAAWLVLFDYFLSSILLLLHLLPPSVQGHKKPGKMSATQADIVETLWCSERYVKFWLCIYFWMLPSKFSTNNMLLVFWFACLFYR